MNTLPPQAVGKEWLLSLAERLAAGLGADKVYLFGSRAWGVPDEGSDVDLLVVVPESDDPPHRRARAAYRLLRGVTVPVEVLVRTRAEVEAAARSATSLVRKAVEQGTLLHG